MGYLNGLANEMGGSTNKIRKELNHLQEAGYLNKVKNENIVEYTANTKHPLYEVLRKVVMKHLGLEDIVDNVLEKMGNVEEIILVGDYANGNDSGRIEIFLVGKDLNMEYISQLESKIEKLRTDLISQEDFEKLQNNAEADFVNSNSSIAGIAGSLATYYMLYDNTDLINTEIDIYRSITKEEIREVANKYLKPTQRVVLEYLPKEQQ